MQHSITGKGINERWTAARWSSPPRPPWSTGPSRALPDGRRLEIRTQSHEGCGSLSRLAYGAFGRRVAPGTKSTTSTGRNCYCRGTHYPCGHSTGTSQRTSSRSGAGLQLFLPFHPSQVGINREQVIVATGDEAQHPKPAIADQPLERRRWCEVIHLARLIFQLQLPEKLEAWFPKRFLIDFGIRFDPGGTLRIGVLGHPIPGATLRLHGDHANQTAKKCRHNSFHQRVPFSADCAAPFAMPKQYCIPSNVLR